MRQVSKISNMFFSPHGVMLTIILPMVLLIYFPCQVVAQVDTIYVSDYYETGDEGTLNSAVKAVRDAGKLSTTVFNLRLSGRYILTDSIYVPEGEHLSIIAPEPGLTLDTSPPQIICSSASYDYPARRQYIIYCKGDVTLKNLWIFYADTRGWQRQVSISFSNNSEDAVQTGTFENVIFDYSSIGAEASGSVSITTKHFKGNFRNCYWKNCTNSTYRYYGRAVSFPYASTGWHIDSLLFENCTFANIGYVLMQEGGEYSDFVKFNHCTFLNTTMYTMESGWWNKLSVTNSIFVNAFMWGHMPLFAEPEEGTIKIDSVANFGFEVPFTDQDRRILFTNSSYGLEKWLQDYMWNNPESTDYRSRGELDRIPQPQPIMNESTLAFFESEDFPYMNKANLYDPSFPAFINPPTDTSAIKDFLLCDWFSGCDIFWEWKPENSLNQLWPLEENLAYTNDTLLTASMNNFPLGDLYRWFPEKYTEWNGQKVAEDERITTWLETGIDPGIVGFEKTADNKVLAGYALSQNYPNPFNPSTSIDFSIPVSGKVTIKIYDIMGQEVQSLIDEYKPAGNYRLEFDGSELTSGVYIYQLESTNFSESRKLVLLK